MQDITTIPTSELEQDLWDSNRDIAVCETALALGQTTYSGASVKDRLDTNRKIVEIITAELARRKVPQ